jgi:hypothetical protein
MESAPQAAANISITVREFRMPQYIQELRRKLIRLPHTDPYRTPKQNFVRCIASNITTNPV